MLPYWREDTTRAGFAPEVTSLRSDRRSGRRSPSNITFLLFWGDSVTPDHRRDRFVAEPSGFRNLSHGASGCRPRQSPPSVHTITLAPTPFMRNYVHELFRAARLAMLAITVAVVPALSPSTVFAQDAGTGKITGRIVDGSTGQPIAAAQIRVVGTAFGTQSGVDGRFLLLRVPAGTITLQVRRIGYGAKTITGLMLPANGAIEQDISLKSAELQLAAVTTTANKEKGSVNDALNAQKNATNAVNSITAEQIAKSPDSAAPLAPHRCRGSSQSARR